MKKKLSLLALALAGFCSPLSAADAPFPELTETLARARAAVGTEDALNAVRTLTFVADVFDAEGKKLSQIELQFKRPYFVREVVRRTETVPVDDFYYPEEMDKAPPPKTAEVEIETLCDGREGVRIVRSKIGDENQRRITWLSPEDVIARRDFAGTNLDFYAPLKADEGTTTFAGFSEEDGRRLALVEYAYASGLKILRAFDTATGALFSTSTGTEKTYDVGEKISSGGLTFLDGSRSVDADGKTKAVFKFSKISVNDDLPDALFRFSLEDQLSGK